MLASGKWQGQGADSSALPEHGGPGMTQQWQKYRLVCTWYISVQCSTCRYGTIASMYIIWNPDFWYMPGIYHVYTIHMVSSSICMVYVWYIHGIYLDIPYISKAVDIPCIYHVYPSIYMVYTQSIYMVYTWMYMVYHLTYIHGISLDIPCIYLDIPSFRKPDFSAGPCCWSHSMRTRL